MGRVIAEAQLKPSTPLFVHKQSSISCTVFRHVLNWKADVRHCSGAGVVSRLFTLAVPSVDFLFDQSRSSVRPKLSVQRTCLAVDFWISILKNEVSGLPNFMGDSCGQLSDCVVHLLRPQRFGFAGPSSHVPIQSYSPLPSNLEMIAMRKRSRFRRIPRSIC